MKAATGAGPGCCCCGGGGCGGVGGLLPGVGGRSSGIGAGGCAPVIAGFDEREEPGFWTGEGADSDGGDGALGVEDSGPASALDFIAFDERGRTDTLGSASGVGDRTPGGGDAISTSDGEGSPISTTLWGLTFGRVIPHKVLSAAPVWGVGVGDSPRLVVACYLRGPRLDCDGNCAPEEGSGWDHTACHGGEEVHGFLAAHCRPSSSFLVKIRPSVLAPVAAPRRSWPAVPCLYSDANGAAPPLAPLSGVVQPSRRRRSHPPPHPTSSLIGHASHLRCLSHNGVNFHGITTLLKSLANCCSPRGGGSAKAGWPPSSDHLGAAPGSSGGSDPDVLLSVPRARSAVLPFWLLATVDTSRSPIRATQPAGRRTP